MKASNPAEDNFSTRKSGVWAMNAGVLLYKNQGELTDEIPKNSKVGLHCICAVHQLGRESKKSA